MSRAFLAYLVLVVAGTPADPMCPVSNPDVSGSDFESLGASTTCQSFVPGGSGYTLTCEGACSSEANLETCVDNFIVDGEGYVMCSGCCPRGSMCCMANGIGGTFAKGCCEKELHCCSNDKGTYCVKDPMMCCKSAVCDGPSQYCCGNAETCCTGDEQCLTSYTPYGTVSSCCPTDRVCNGFCCKADQICAANSCISTPPPIGSCKFLGVDLSSVDSRSLGNDTYDTTGEFQLNPCGPLLYTHRQLGCYSSSMICFEGVVSSGGWPPVAWLNGSSLVLNTTMETSGSFSSKSIIRFECGHERMLVLDREEDDGSYIYNFFTYYVPALCGSSRQAILIGSVGAAVSVVVLGGGFLWLRTRARAHYESIN